MTNSGTGAVGTYLPSKVACRAYDSRSAHVAREVAEWIASFEPRLRAEHIGSTSVPGCDGSGVVDLMIPFASGKEADVHALLDRLGFQHGEGLECRLRKYPVRLGSWTYDREVFPLHLYLIASDSPMADAVRFFRLCLQSDPELVRAYVGEKKAILADGVVDAAAYGQRKNQFFEHVLG